MGSDGTHTWSINKNHAAHHAIMLHNIKPYIWNGPVNGKYGTVQVKGPFAQFFCEVVINQECPEILGKDITHQDVDLTTVMQWLKANAQSPAHTQKKGYLPGDYEGIQAALLAVYTNGEDWQING